MSRIELLKKLLPGFIPLFVFIAADEIWGTKAGLIVAVAVGIAEMVWVAAREKRLDTFILFDTLLLVVLGAVSILLENDLFFSIPPTNPIFSMVYRVDRFTGLKIISYDEFIFSRQLLPVHWFD